MTVGLYDIVSGISQPPGAAVKLCRVVSRTNITNPTGLLTVDGVTLAEGDRVLLSAQTSGANNGVWTVQGSGVAWTRATEADDGNKLRSGTIVCVSEGTSYKGTIWQLQTTGTITVGSTSLTFVQVNASTGGVSDGDKGDITVSGSGATWTIDNDAVTFAKIQNVTDARVLGRSAGSAGDCQELTVSAPLTLAAGALGVSVGTLGTDVCAGNDARLSNARTPTAHQSSHQSGGSDALSGNLDAIARTTVRKNSDPANVGSRRRLNFIEGTNVTLTIADDSANEEVDITIAAASGGLSDGDKGDITVSGSGATWTIDPDAVTYAKIQNVTDARLLGRSAGSAGDCQELTVSSPLSLSAGALSLPAATALDNIARTTVRKNSGADVGSRRRINLIEGSNVTLTVADDSVNEEVDVTIAASVTGGSGLSFDDSYALQVLF